MVPNHVRYQTALHLVLWRRRRDSNPRTSFTQPNPLAGDPLEPLEYFSKIKLEVAERVGFEPTVPHDITGFQDQLLKPLGHLSKKMIYPRFELGTPWLKVKCSTDWANRPGYLIPMELVIGIEPTTCWLQVSCSTVEPHQHINGGSNRARTCDPLLVRQMLSQLSYTPTLWLLGESNPCYRRERAVS